MSESKTTELPDLSVRGRITWHSSEEDGGPDVGLSLGLGDGVSLYVGDITRSSYEDAGAPLADCGGDGGWWAQLYRPGGAEVLGKLLGEDEGHTLIDTLCAALNTRPTPSSLSSATGDVIPAGWRLVPEEGTDEQLEAGDEAAEPAGRRIDGAVIVNWHDVYKAMVAAAPQLPARTVQQPSAVREALEAVRAFATGIPAHWSDAETICIGIPEGEPEPENSDEPSPLTIGHLRALSALSRPAGEGAWIPTHQHRKGGLYRVITRGELEADLSPVVIYESKHGRVWVRPAAEFDDGRFAPLPAHPLTTSAEG